MDRKSRKDIVEAKDVTFGYDPRKPIIRNLNLNIKQGDFLAILGTNGAGKTTLVKILNGLLRPQKGRIFLDGHDSSQMSPKEISNIVGYCYQNPDHQIFCETVAQEIEFGLKNRGVSPDEMEERVNEALELVDLYSFRNHAPYQLGKGERQKLAVASIVALRPKILIVDEPTTGLDWNDAKNIFNMLKQFVEQGTTCIIVTHNIYIVDKYIERCVLMDDGKIIADGNTKDILLDKEALEKASITSLRITSIVDEFNGRIEKKIPRTTKVEEFVAFLQKELNSNE